MEHVSINAHSSIRIGGEKTVYFDPYLMKEEPHDADVIFVTHEHFDHFSPADIEKVMKEDTVLVVPASMELVLADSDLPVAEAVFMDPGDEMEVCGIPVQAVAAYNPDKKFHQKDRNWVGYAVTLNGLKYYVCGDMDATPEGLSVKCDVVFIPVGGTYTFNAKEAAAFVNELKPGCAVPTHYGSGVVGDRGDGKRFCALVDPGIKTEIVIK